VEDKENNPDLSNHIKTPTHHYPRDRSPGLFHKNKKDLSDIKVKKQNDSCLTPKGKMTPKATPTKSGLKQHKSELTANK